MSDTVLSLTGLPARPGATISDIEAAERDLGVRLPEDYRAFLRESDGIEGFSGPGGDYLMLWGAGEIAKSNAGYCVSEFAPGLVLIGSNGGGDAFGFVRRDGRFVYVRLPLIALDIKEAEVVGETLLDLVQGARGRWGTGSALPTEVQRRLGLVQAASSGTLTDLPCPLCDRPTVSVRFTHPAPTEWRTWFLCSSCPFEMRTQNSGEPPHFSNELVDPALEERDRA